LILKYLQSLEHSKTAMIFGAGCGSARQGVCP
jgi:hypothetical protein